MTRESVYPLALIVISVPPRISSYCTSYHDLWARFRLGEDTTTLFLVRNILL